MKEASQVWFSAAKYIPTVAETAWKSTNPAPGLPPLSSVTTAVLSDTGSLSHAPPNQELAHRVAEPTAP